MDETIVFLMREFGLTYQYTRDLVKNLPIKKLNALVTEARYQREMEDYKLASYAAMIVSCLASSDKKRVTITEIIGQPPKRLDEPDKAESIRQAAEVEGIELPKEE